MKTVAHAEHHIDGEPIAANTYEMRKKWKLKEDDIHEVWRRGLRVVDYPEGEHSPYRVISAGADGKLLTRDDISYPRPA